MHGESEGEAYLVLWTCTCSNVVASFVLLQYWSWKYQGYYLHIGLTVGRYSIDNGEHRAKVIVHYVCHVIDGCDNNSFQSFQWPYVFPYYSSLVDIIKSKGFGDCVYKFLQCLILYYVFLFYNSFNLSPSCYVFCDSFFIVGPSFCFIGSLPPSNSLFGIIVDPRWIVDGGSSFRDVFSACITDSAIENFKS